MNEKVNVTVLKPEKDEWFEVNPLAINQNLFPKKREDFLKIASLFCCNH